MANCGGCCCFLCCYGWYRYYGIPLLFRKPRVFPYLIFKDFCNSYIFHTCIRILGGILQIINLTYRIVANAKSLFLSGCLQICSFSVIGCSIAFHNRGTILKTSGIWKLNFFTLSCGIYLRCLYNSTNSLGSTVYQLCMNL